MYQGFPVSLISLLRCPSDGRELRSIDAEGAESFVWQGQLQCTGCSRRFEVGEGVVRFLDQPLLHAESLKEMQLRDTKSESFENGQRKEWRSEYDDEIEIKPTIRMLQPLNNKVVAEYGCGTGRYTLEFSKQAAAVLAIDFSMASLRVLSQKTDIGENTGLVQADVTTFRLALGAFDRVLSTLHSNLPTREHRMASNRFAADILKDEGRYVFSMHYHGLRDLLLGVPRSGYYPENGIYRYHMRAGEAKKETLPYFDRVHFSLIKVSIPGLHSIFLSQAARRVPLLNEMAQLLLGEAEKPIRTK